MNVAAPSVPSSAPLKLNDVAPLAYLKNVLERMSSGHHMSRLDDLLPWNWNPSNTPTWPTCQEWTLNPDKIRHP